MPNAGTIGRDVTVVPGLSRRFSMFSTKVRSTTATSFATASGKRPECIAGKDHYGDWPNSEGVSYTILEHSSNDWRLLTSSDTSSSRSSMKSEHQSN